MTMGARVLCIAALVGTIAATGAMPALAGAEAAPAAKVGRVTIPANQLRYFCFKGAEAFSVGMITCLARDRWGVCKWADKGSITSVPQGRAYWQNSVAPGGACP
jgi:hypothetical protein